ncbi:hypothetical protein GCM10027024_27740 [Microbacterium insulae]
MPGRNPQYTYNPRSDRELEERLRLYLDDGGAILTLVGPTKTGKTVLLREVIETPVWIEAQGIDSAETFWALVGNELGLYVDSGTSSDSNDSLEGGGGVNAGVFNVGGKVTTSTGQSLGKSAVRVTSVESRKALQDSGRVLVVDDFHFIARDVQQQIVQAVKPLVYNDTRVVFAAISHRVLDVPQAVDDMAGRTEPLRIELWKIDELLVIARRGFEKLRVVDYENRLARTLAENSFGSPHLMQRLCREFVRDVNEISEAVQPARDLHEPADWDEFFRKQVDGRAGQWFARLLSGPKKGGNTRTTYDIVDGRKVDGYGLILLAVAATLPELVITRQKLNSAIDVLVGEGAKPADHQVTRFLKHMTRIAGRSLEEDVLPEELLDEEDADGTYIYAGVEPVLEYVEDGPNSVLSIADPFIAYYIRWGAGLHIEALTEQSETPDPPSR